MSEPDDYAKQMEEYMKQRELAKKREEEEH